MYLVRVFRVMIIRGLKKMTTLKQGIGKEQQGITLVRREN